MPEPSSHVAIEEILIHVLSHLGPAELAHANASCAFRHLAGTQVVLSTAWLSRTIGAACGMLLQMEGELTTDVDYAALPALHL